MLSGGVRRGEEAPENVSGSLRCVRLEEVEGVDFLAHISALIVLCLDGDIFPLIPTHLIG